MINHIDGELVQAIEAIPAFQKTAKQLGVDLRRSDEDAQELLIVQILDHRLSNWTYNKIYKAAIDRDVSLVSIFDYARKDIRRSHYMRESQELEKENELRSASNDAGSIPPDLGLLAIIFHNHKTLAWVRCLLLFGRSETQERFHQTDREFLEKLRKVIKFCDENPAKLAEVRANYKKQQEQLTQANIDYESGNSDISSDDIINQTYEKNKQEDESHREEVEQQVMKDVERKNKAIADKEKAQWAAFMNKHGAAFTPVLSQQSLSNNQEEK